MSKSETGSEAVVTLPSDYEITSVSGHQQVASTVDNLLKSPDSTLSAAGNYQLVHGEQHEHLSLDTSDIVSNEHRPSSSCNSTSANNSTLALVQSNDSLHTQQQSSYAIRSSIEWKIGTRLEAKDFKQNWYLAKIVDIGEDRRVLIHFEGWNQRWDQWMEMNSEMLRPLTRHSDRNEKGKQTKLDHKVGDNVFAKWVDCRMYPAVIMSLDVSGNYEVMFYDGVRKLVQPMNVKTMQMEVQSQYANAGLLPEPGKKAKQKVRELLKGAESDIKEQRLRKKCIEKRRSSGRLSRETNQSEEHCIHDVTSSADAAGVFPTTCDRSMETNESCISSLGDPEAVAKEAAETSLRRNRTSPETVNGKRKSQETATRKVSEKMRTRDEQSHISQSTETQTLTVTPTELSCDTASRDVHTEGRILRGSEKKEDKLLTTEREVRTRWKIKKTQQDLKPKSMHRQSSNSDKLSSDGVLNIDNKNKESHGIIDSLDKSLVKDESMSKSEGNESREVSNDLGRSEEDNKEQREAADEHSSVTHISGNERQEDSNYQHEKRSENQQIEQTSANEQMRSEESGDKSVHLGIGKKKKVPTATLR